MKRALLALLLIALWGCAAGESTADDCELLVINVGKGDAILVKLNGDAYLIDAGYARAWGKVSAALREENVSRLKGVFLTHADDDHAGGLMPLALSDIEVEAWYASGYCLEYKEKKHPAVLAAAARGQRVNWLYAGDSVDGAFSVLAPAQLIDDKEDNNSLVMLLRTQSGNALLTGDMEYAQEDVLLASGVSLKCDLFKVPNHADDDTASARLINATGASIALISTDPYEKVGTPDPALMARLQSANMQIYRTDMSDMGIRAYVDNAGARAEYASFADKPPLVTGARIISVDAEADTVTLEFDVETDLTGWYLYSERGKEFMPFPKNTRALGQIVVGSLSSANFDILWDDKNVIHNSKEDIIILFDDYGRAVSSASSLSTY